MDAKLLIPKQILRHVSHVGDLLGLRVNTISHTKKPSRRAGFRGPPSIKIYAPPPTPTTPLLAGSNTPTTPGRTTFRRVSCPDTGLEAIIYTRTGATTGQGNVGEESDDDPPHSILSKDSSSESDVSLFGDADIFRGGLDNPFKTPPASPAIDRSRAAAPMANDNEPSEAYDLESTEDEDWEKARKIKTRSKLIQVLGVEAGTAFNTMQM